MVKHPFLWAIIALCICPRAMAGHESNNGGGAMVCRDKDGKITHSELLDLWEGTRLMRLSLIDDSVDVKTMAHRASTRWTHVNPMLPFAGTVVDFTTLRLLNDVYERQIGFLPPGVGIAAPRDTGHNYVEKGCAIEGVASLNDTYGTFDIDKEIFDTLPPQHQAALFIHEGVYQKLRFDYNVQDSIAARRITACLFASETCQELNPLADLPSGEIVQCADERNASTTAPPNIAFYQFERMPGSGIQNNTRWQFTSFNHTYVPSKLFVDLNLYVEAPPADGYQAARIGRGNVSPLAFTMTTKTAEDRWHNIGPELTVKIAIDADGKLRVNDMPIVCRRTHLVDDQP